MSLWGDLHLFFFFFYKKKVFLCLNQNRQKQRILPSSPVSEQQKFRNAEKKLKIKLNTLRRISFSIEIFNFFQFVQIPNFVFFVK